MKTNTDIFGPINNSLRTVSHQFINGYAILTLVICVIVALLLGRLVARILRYAVLLIGTRADRSKSLQQSNRLRRYETYIVLSIALIRSGLVLAALYVWWVLIHPDGQPTAIIGASALAAIIISSSFAPLLRDIAAGGAMMAEQWYGVGDLVRIEPFADMQGVVERVTLRSTRIRGLNGEIIWVNNQNIQAVRLTPRGTRAIALEFFVHDRKAGEVLVERANRRLPQGPLLVSRPLEVVDVNQVGEKLWHITAMGETAPGRDWLLERSAVDLLTELDAESEHPILDFKPLARFADAEAEKRFKRTITNAQKRPLQPRSKIRRTPPK
jgi:hypothetical protein